MTQTQKLIINLFLVFLLGFGFIYVCYVGLPYDFGADHPKNIRGIESIGYGELIELVMDPRTPVWFYPPGNRADLMAFVRPLQFLLLKLSYSLVGYSLPHFHIIVAIGCGILMMLLFSVIVFWTRSMLWGWLAAVLYLSFPSNVFMLLSAWSGDFQFFLSVICIFSLLLFGHLTSRKLKSISFLANLALWVIFIWLAIKIKSTEKILPIVCLVFLLWQFRSIQAKIGGWRTSALILFIAGMFFLIVPSQAYFRELLPEARHANLTPSSAETTSSITIKDKQALSFSWQNALRRTFYASDEKFSLTAIFHRDRNPLSFTENYGLPLGLFFWLGLFFSFFLWAGPKARHSIPEESQQRESFSHFFKLFLVWFGVVLAGFSSGMDLSVNRFLNFAYVPSLLLLFMMIGGFSNYFSWPVVKSRIFRALIVLLIIATALFNFGTFIKLLGYYGGMQATVVRAEKDIFPLIYGKNPDEVTLYEKHQDLEQRAVAVGWYNYTKDWTDVMQEKLRTEKRVFLYLRTPDPERLQRLRENGFEITLWKQYSLLDADPLVFHFLKKLYHLGMFSGKTPSTDFFVYMIKRVST